MISISDIAAVADHGALHAIMRQRVLSGYLDKAVGEHQVHVDLEESVCHFTSNQDSQRRVSARAHLIASIAPGPRSLMWGWAMPQYPQSEPMTALRDLGAQHGLAALTTAEVPFDTTATGEALGDEVAQFAHVVAAAAIEASGVAPYYSLPVGRGTRAVLLLDGLPLRPPDLSLDGAGLMTAFMDAATTNPRASLLGYARHGDFGVVSAADGSSEELTDSRGSRITVHFHPNGNLSEIKMHLTPPHGELAAP